MIVFVPTAIPIGEQETLTVAEVLVAPPLADIVNIEPSVLATIPRGDGVTLIAKQSAPLVPFPSDGKPQQTPFPSIVPSAEVATHAAALVTSCARVKVHSTNVLVLSRDQLRLRAPERTERDPALTMFV